MLLMYNGKNLNLSKQSVNYWKSANVIARELNHYTHAQLNKNEIAPESTSKVRPKKFAGS